MQTPSVPEPAGAGRAAGYLRRMHTEQVVTLLRSGPISRAEIGAQTGLSRATVSTIVGELISSGTAQERVSAEDRRAGAGRPTRQVALCEHSVRSLGVAFHLASVKVAVADPLQRITGTAEREHRPGLDWPERVSIAIDEVHRLCREHQVESASLVGIGMGVTGPVSSAPCAAPWRGAADELAQRFGAPVHVDNIQRLAALAETTWGAGHGHQSVLYFHLAEGIGAGIVIEGRLYRGATGAAGELGHVRIDPAGPECRCGGNGCLETRAALPELLRRAGVRRSGRTLAELAADPALAAQIDAAAAICGAVVGQANTTLDVVHVVVGGLLEHVADETLRLFTDAVRTNLLPTMRATLRVSRARLGGRGSVMGGIALVHHNSPALQGYEAFRATPAPRTGGDTSRAAKER